MSEASHVIRYKRLRYGNYYADFRADKRLRPRVYHCIVQRDGLPEVLFWSQHRSLDTAVRLDIARTCSKVAACDQTSFAIIGDSS
jgi:hypothetical protein